MMLFYYQMITYGCFKMKQHLLTCGEEEFFFFPPFQKLSQLPVFWGESWEYSFEHQGMYKYTIIEYEKQQNVFNPSFILQELVSFMLIRHTAIDKPKDL